MYLLFLETFPRQKKSTNLDMIKNCLVTEVDCTGNNDLHKLCAQCKNTCK